MKKHCIRLAALAAAVISAGLFFAVAGPNVSAAKTNDPITISRYNNGDVFVYKNYPATLEFGQKMTRGDLYVNGVKQGEHSFSLKYSYGTDKSTLEEDPNRFNRTGTFNIHLMDGTRTAAIIGTFTMVKGNIQNMEAFVSKNTVDPFDKEYLDQRVYIQDYYGSILSTEGCQFIRGTSANPDNLYPGEAQIKIDTTNSELFYGTKTLTYQVKPIYLNTGNYEIANVEDKTYRSEPITFDELRLCMKTPDSSKVYSISIRDDELTYKNNIDTGTASVTVSGQRFVGSITKNFEIEPYSVDSYFPYEQAHYPYTGNPIEPGLSMLANNYFTMLRDIDYEVTGYKSNINSGISYIHIKGIGNCTGEKDVVFYIDDLSIKDAKIDIPDVTYFDSLYYLPKKVTVTMNGKKLEYNNDYTVLIEGDEVTVTGMGNYTDSVTRKLNYVQADLSKAEIEFVSDTEYVFDYQEKKPGIYLRLKTAIGNPNIYQSNYYFSDYFNLSYSDNVNAGTAKITISAKDTTKCKNSISTTFEIKPVDASMLSVKAPNKYTGNNTSPTVKYSEHFLKPGKDFDLKLSNEGLGTVDATLTFKGNYKGQLSLNYFLEADLSDAKIKNIDLYEYGYPVVTFDLNGMELIQDKHYYIETSDIFQADRDRIFISIKRCLSSGVIGSKEINLDLKDVLCDIGHYDELVVPDQTYMTDLIEPYFDMNGRRITLYNLREQCCFPKVTVLDQIDQNTGMLSLKIDVNDFAVTMYKSYKIKDLSLSTTTISDIAPVQYTGNPLQPAISVLLSNGKELDPSCYTVEYKDNVNVGTATVTVTGIGKCKGSITAHFSIVPKSTPTPTSNPAKPGNPTGVAPTGSAKPTKAVVPSGEPGSKIMEFVERIYIYVLDREPEAEGAAFWTSELYAFRRTGAEVGLQFIFSDEFTSRGTSDTEFVTILYKTFFGRDPESDGLEFWLSQLSSGTMDRMTVATGFVYSQEWADTCASYGIRSGGDLKPTGTIAPSALTYAFVERMYTTCMGRGYDEEGRQYWAVLLANFETTGEIVGASFFLSDEMNGYGLSDQEFLNRLYLTFMDREADADGASYWLGVLASGTPRADVVFGFTRSPEFTDKCIEARILPY